LILRRLYYCPLAGFSLYSVDTSILKDEATATDVAALGTVIRLEGVKPSQTDGMIISSDGVLYLGLLGESSVVAWNTSYSCDNETDNQQCQTDDFSNQLESFLSRGAEDLEWPDTFAIDGGYLYVTTNRLNRFFSGIVNATDYNYRILRTFLGTGSYLES
jgi:sugar lactone lactonase YvrE